MVLLFPTALFFLSNKIYTLPHNHLISAVHSQSTVAVAKFPSIIVLASENVLILIGSAPTAAAAGAVVAVVVVFDSVTDNSRVDAAVVVVFADSVTDNSRVDAAVVVVFVDSVTDDSRIDDAVEVDTPVVLAVTAGAVVPLAAGLLTIAVALVDGGLMTVVRVVAVMFELVLGMAPAPNWLLNDPAPQRHEQSYAPFVSVVATPWATAPAVPTVMVTAGALAVTVTN